MAHIHLIEGPVGAGKSTFASQLGKSRAGPRLTLDDWMATLFRPDRPTVGVMAWYLERKDRCLDQIWQVTCGLLDAGTDAILELGLIQQHSRQRFYDRVDAAGYHCTVYVLDASREVRRQRVRERNRQQGETFSMEVPDQFFEMASDMWEQPDESECAGRDVRLFLPRAEHAEACRSDGDSWRPRQGLTSNDRDALARRVPASSIREEHFSRKNRE